GGLALRRSMPFMRSSEASWTQPLYSKTKSFQIGHKYPDLLKPIRRGWLEAIKKYLQSLRSTRRQLNNSIEIGKSWRQYGQQGKMLKGQADQQEVASGLSHAG